MKTPMKRGCRKEWDARLATSTNRSNLMGCEDLDKEYNEADRLFCAPLFVAVATALAVAPTAAFAAISAAA